jgi:hypothetical protein
MGWDGMGWDGMGWDGMEWGTHVHLFLLTVFFVSDSFIICFSSYNNLLRSIIKYLPL